VEGRAKLPGSAQARGAVAGGKQQRNLAARVYSGDLAGRRIKETALVGFAYLGRVANK
jgi:hypothetical protein